MPKQITINVTVALKVEIPNVTECPVNITTEDIVNDLNYNFESGSVFPVKVIDTEIVDFE